jgi:hypothetical protein
MEYVNLTPHMINVHTPEGVRDIPPSGDVARVSSTSELVGFLDGIPLFRTVYGEVTGLPAPRDGEVFVVSGMVAGRVSREDVFSPGNLFLDEAGRPIGCEGLRVSGA